MSKLSSNLILALASLSVSSVAMANAFNSFDPKSMAMGGAAAAVADPATAPFFNPALLSVAEKDDDFSIELPIFGLRVSDKNDLYDKIDGTDVLVDEVDIAIQNFNSQSLGASYDSESTKTMISSINNLNDRISSLSNSPISGQGGLGTVIAIPSENWGIAFSASAQLMGTGIFQYKDSATVSGFTNDISILDSCLANNASESDRATCLNAEISNGSFKQITVNTNPSNGAVGEVTFSANDDMQSEIQFIGVLVTEVGLSISKETFIGEQELAFGITPKAVTVSVIDYRANVSDAENSIDNITDETTDYSDFNFDLGVAKDFNNGWRAGFTVKNLLSNTYEAKTVGVTNSVKIKIEPQARLGLSHQNSWSTVAFDLDLTEDKSLAELNGSTKYASIGAELNAWDVMQLRFGYRADLVNSDQNMTSIGVGFSPFGVHFDIAAAIGDNENEVGVAMQFGFRF